MVDTKLCLEMSEEGEEKEEKEESKHREGIIKSGGKTDRKEVRDEPENEENVESGSE